MVWLERIIRRRASDGFFLFRLGLLKKLHKTHGVTASVKYSPGGVVDTAL